MESLLTYESFKDRGNSSIQINEKLEVKKNSKGNIVLNGEEYQLEANFNPGNYLNPFGKKWNRVQIVELNPSGENLKVKITEPTELESSIDKEIVGKIEQAVGKGEKEIEIPGLVTKRLVKV
jgi:hypothetical protein